MNCKWFAIAVPLLCLLLTRTFPTNGQILKFEDFSLMPVHSQPPHLRLNEMPSTDTSKIVELFRGAKFTSSNDKIVNMGIAKTPLWLHFKISNRHNKKLNLILSIENPRINFVQLYLLNRDTLVTLGVSGDTYPFKHRKFFNKNLNYEFSIQYRDSSHFFLFVNQTGHTLTLPIKVFHYDDFQRYSLQKSILDGITYGILTGIFLLSLCLYIATKHSLYLSYSLYILTAIAWFWAYFGLGYQLIWPNYPSLNTGLSPFFACTNLCLNFLICQCLLNLKTISYIIYNVGQVCVYLLLLTAVIPLAFNLHYLDTKFNAIYLYFFLSVILFSLAIIFFSVCLYSLNGSITARFYFVASLLKIGSIIHLALVELGTIPAYFNSETYLQFGILIEIGLLTFALANRYKRHTLNFFSEIIKVQEQERTRIAKDIHDGISNNLTGIKYALITLGMKNNFNLDIKERLALIRQKVEETQFECRSLSHSMMPDYILRMTLSQSMTQYIADVNTLSNVKSNESECLKIKLVTSSIEREVPDHIKLHVFRITQEIIGNILKHSKATEATLVLSINKKFVTLTSEDNGIGVTLNGTDSLGMGIATIKSRIKIVGGKFKMSSKEAGLTSFAGNISDLKETVGSSFTIKIPLKRNIALKTKHHEY